MALTSRRVLVTGARGFVGSHLCRALESRGVNVLTLASHSGKPTDITNWHDVNEFGKTMGTVDVVFHLAARTSVPLSMESPRDTYHVNVQGTANILEMCRLRNVERVVYASSYVYGPPQYLPVDEGHPLAPNNPYTRSKLMGEGLCRAYYEDYGVKCTILRPFNIYGEGQSDSFLIPSVLSQLAGGRVELTDPEPKRDLLHVSDAVDAYVKAGEYRGTDYDVFNIGSGYSYRVEDVVLQILREWGQEVSVSYRNSRRKNEIMDMVADIKKARQHLGWSPRIELKEGLRRCVMWHKSRLQPAV